MRRISALVALILIISTFWGCAAPATTATVATATVAATATPTASPTATAAPVGNEESEALLQGQPEADHAPAPLERDCYNFTLSFDPEARILTGQMTLDYLAKASEPIYSLVLNLYPNRVTPNAVKVTSVCVNGEPSYFEVKNAQLMAPLPREITAGETARLYAEFTVAVPEKPDELGTHSFLYSFAGALPTAAIFQNGAWRSDAYSTNGDPCIFDAADYRVLISLPEEYRVAATGSVLDDVTENGVRMTLLQASGVREFFFAAVKSAAVSASASDAKLTVTAYTQSRARSELAVKIALDALEFFGEKIAPYPYSALAVVQADIGNMKLAQAVMLDKYDIEPDEEPQSAFAIAREAARQWFYGVIGTDGAMEPWVDEAMANFLATEYIKSRYPSHYDKLYALAASHSTNGMRLDLSVYDYPDTGEYLGVCSGGIKMYKELFDELGEETFYSALKTMYYSFATSRMHGEDLIAAFSEAAGRDMGAFFEARLKGEGGTPTDATITDATGTDATPTDATP